MRRKGLSTTVTVAILGAAAAGFVLAWESGGTRPAASPAVPPAAATVTRTTLVETKTVPGTLGYGDPVPVSAVVPGTLTWIAPAGSTLKRGKPLFKIDQRPVVGLYGPVPMYRTLNVGTKGADVRQLERNLAKLGYTGFTVDDTYDAATAVAVSNWQAGLGLPTTGAVERSLVVFTPGAVRIAAHMARPGDIIGGGSPVLTCTGTTRRVTVKLGVADEALAVKGRTVTVTIPGRGTVQGKVARIGTTVTAPPAAPEGTTSSGGNSSAGPSPASTGASIEVSVTIADQKSLGRLDSAPVDVDLIASKRKDVLAVPVAALLALPQGGFGVQVVNGSRTRIVPVKTGMFAAGQVEVTGKGIAEGVRVGVPK